MKVALLTSKRRFQINDEKIDNKLKNDEVLGIYSLNQTDIHTVHNLIGDSEIIIENGKARFSKSPCKKQYCIHQGWINKINQIVICMPNQISISIIGDKENYDAINY